MAALLDPAHPAVLATVERSREIFGRVGAIAWLERLDSILESRGAVRPRPGLQPETHPVA